MVKDADPQESPENTFTRAALESVKPHSTAHTHGTEQNAAAGTLPGTRETPSRCDRCGGAVSARVTWKVNVWESRDGGGVEHWSAVGIRDGGEGAYVSAGTRWKVLIEMLTRVFKQDAEPVISIVSGQYRGDGVPVRRRSEFGSPLAAEMQEVNWEGCPSEAALLLETVTEVQRDRMIYELSAREEYWDMLCDDPAALKSQDDETICRLLAIVDGGNR